MPVVDPDSVCVLIHLRGVVCVIAIMSTKYNQLCGGRNH